LVSAGRPGNLDARSGPGGMATLPQRFTTRKPATQQPLHDQSDGQGCRASRPKQTSRFTTRPTPDDLDKNGP